jgi:4,5-dihydroxyphthalate decarboxylase
MVTLALDRYDRHLPFFDGTVRLPAGLDLEVLQVGQTADERDGGRRHERMLQDGAFDAAETSLASYLVARSRGLLFAAIPVFPRRLFSQGQIFVNAAAGIEAPAQLAGRTVGLQSFQTTLAVLAKGDLAFEYGVTLASIKWRVQNADTVEVAHHPDYDIARLPAGADLTALLAEGAIDALFYSRTPRPRPGHAGRIRRLFADPRAEEARYVQKHGYWPIMHVVALKEEAVARRPDLPELLMRAFADAERIAASYLGDPNWSRLAWAKYTAEEEERAFARTLWTSGLAANRANLERFIAYARDQALIGRALSADELFHPSVRAT